MMTMDPRKTLFNTTVESNTLQIQMPPRLTLLESDSFRQFFQAVLQQNRALSQIVLDFDQTQLMDSSGVGAFLSNLKWAQSREIHLVSKNVGPEVMMVFSLMGLDQVLTIEPKINELR